MTKLVFDTVRQIKGVPLTQADVDALNAALAGELAAPCGAIPLAAKIIAEFEGCRLDAYPDPGSGGDPWTIGVGATGPGIKKGVRWTQAQCDARLHEDVARFAEGVARLLGSVPTTDPQRAAMISLAYNIGLGNFGSSTLLRLHKAGDHTGAMAQFARWSRAAGKVMPGLARRRAAEAALYGGAV